MEIGFNKDGSIVIEAETIFERSWLSENYKLMDGTIWTLEVIHDSFRSELIFRRKP